MINLKQIPLRWLMIGLFALAISGLFSIVLAVSWHPSVKSFPIFATLFHRSLIAHVNLSITIWFLCFAFALMDYNKAQITRLPLLNSSAQWLILISILLMTIASLQPEAEAVLCNYIPLLNHPLFFLSLGCCFAAILLKLLDYAHLALSSPRPHDFLQHHNHIIAGILLMSLLAFGLSSSQVAAELNFSEDPLIYGEMMFWGGGHVLQYAWVQLMLFAWVMMLAHILPDFKASAGVRLISYVNLLAVLTSPIPYLLHPVTSGDFRELFTWLMAWLSGIAPVLFVIYFIVNRLRTGLRIIPPYNDMISASLWWSLLLFGLGGAFAVMINGINVKIPAHYHGSLLGVTVALMGLTYLLLQTHFQSYAARKLGFWQPALLGIGQVMHIVGLFWSGGYGVQRKSPTQSGEAMELADLALRIQSSGGGIAIIGGLLFLIICYKLWRKR